MDIGTIVLAVSLVLLALEHFGAAIPPWLTGTFLILAAIFLFV
jgi:hypothetical protein